MRNWIKRKLKQEQRIRLMQIKNRVLGLMQDSNLKSLAHLNYCDKILEHNYIQWYELHFGKLRRKKLNLFEIGIGGDENRYMGGASLRMWRSYFKRSMITGLDIVDKSIFSEPRINIYMGSQTDESLLKKIDSEKGPFDIIIDDGSHRNEHVLKSFSVLFPLLKSGGIYVIEDTQTSYWPSYGGKSTKNPSRETSMGFFRELIDGLNYEEFEFDYDPTYYDKNIVGISFYHNIIFINKGNNTEGSNIIKK